MKRAAPYISLALLTLLAYANTWRHSFHFDDIPSILEKPWIRGLDKIPDFIFSFWQRPLVILSFNLNYAVSEFEVWSYHAFNIAMHIVAVFLLYRFAQLIQRLLVEPLPSGFPFLAACLFALHPLNTQSVTYISSRSSVMATVFYLSAILFYFSRTTAKESSNAPSLSPALGAGFFFALGMLSKQIVVTLPAAMVLFHYFFVSRSGPSEWLRASWRWLAGGALTILAAIIYKARWGGGLVTATENDATPWAYFLIQTQVIPLEYFRKMLLPLNLSLDSDLVAGAFSLKLLPGILILVFYIALCGWLILRKSNALAALSGFSLLWILVALAPTSSVIPLLDVMVEHRTYLPMIGFCLLASALLTRAASQIAATRTAIAKAAFACGIAALLLLLTAGTVLRNEVWKDEVTLWTDVKQKYPNHLRAINNLGSAYDKKGDYENAIKELKSALALNPNYVQALSNLGNIYGKQRKFQESIPIFEKVIQLDPSYAPAHYNLAKARDLTGNKQAAAESYRLAIKHNPYFEEAYFNLGFILLDLRQPDEAIKNFKAFLEMQPRNAKAYFGLGNAHMLKNDVEAAIAAYQQSAAADPDFLSPHINAGSLQIQRGNIDDALATFLKLAERHPKIGGVQKNLGIIYLQFKNQPEKAIPHFEAYLRLEPNAGDSAALRQLVNEMKQSGK
ncbi:MAG: tetratricopeptide repeat protein [Candidatus Nitrohelix vancouverensis]|uniref:Tetratricopeptide repeat protein n=1 Tax=Candidatus Nitrohelix vancouverensis TaxID=2705534 RepID=A0A7T0C1T1_9BACT|nr:MAG: tetratricopeptide repeat protein [Candidatus Nitrohelix vancouverensis]